MKYQANYWLLKLDFLSHKSQTRISQIRFMDMKIYNILLDAIGKTLYSNSSFVPDNNILIVECASNKAK